MILEPIFSVFQILEGGINVAAPTGILLLGLITGLRHSLEADHVAAVSTMISAASSKRKLRQAPMLGALWGLGHTTSLFIAGLVVLLLAINIPQKVSGMLEFGVGIMLIFLAATALTGFNIGKFFRVAIRRENISNGEKEEDNPQSIKDHHYYHEHPHFHKENHVALIHTHPHDHNMEAHRHGHKSLIVGMIHGMAGSGALMVIVLSTINSIPLGLAYIAIFGAGSIASMVGVSTVIGLPFSKLSNFTKVSMMLKYATAITTLIIGVGLVYDLAIVEKIFL